MLSPTENKMFVLLSWVNEYDFFTTQLLKPLHTPETLP